MGCRNAGIFFVAEDDLPECETLPAQLQRVIETDRCWREQLRSLPIEAKLRILTEMQGWAQAIRIATERPPKGIWELKEMSDESATSQGIQRGATTGEQG